MRLSIPERISRCLRSTLLLAGGLCLLAGCRTPTNKSAFEREMLAPDSSVTMLRMATFDYVETFALEVETVADRIIEQSDDPALKRQALLWKINVIPMCLSAQDHPSPVGGLLDCWALSGQYRAYLESEESARRLGEFQSVALASATDLEARAMAIASRYLRPDQFQKTRELLDEWVQEHPVQGEVFERPTGGQDLIRWLGQRTDADIFSTVENLETELELLRATLSLQLSFLPRQARWQAELLALDAMEDQVPALMDRTFDQFSAERAIVLEDIERQRAETLRFVQEERQRIVNEFKAERAVVFAAVESSISSAVESVDLLLAEHSAAGLREVNRQRMETITTIREERLETIAEADRLAEEVVDAFYSRIWLVLIVTWMGLAGLVVLARLLFGGRRAG